MIVHYLLSELLSHVVAVETSHHQFAFQIHVVMTSCISSDVFQSRLVVLPLVEQDVPLFKGRVSQTLKDPSHPAPFLRQVS